MKMKINCAVLPLIVVLSVALCSLTYSSEIMVPAAQIQKNKADFVLYWDRSDQALSLQISSKDEIKINSSSYFSEVTNDFSSKGRSNSVVAKITLNPVDGFYYWLKAGSGSYDLEIPSSSITNKLSGRNPGSIVGLGLRSILFPDTIVTPAVSVDFGVTYSAYDLDTFQSGQTANQFISNKLEMAEIQAAAAISKKFSKLEPYGGIKIFRTYVSLRETAALGSVSGYKDNAGVFAGTRFYLHQFESLVVETSFIGETAVSLGWNINF